MKYFSKQTGGFYDLAIHGDGMPSDAVEISDEQYAYLWNGHMLGKRIVGDALGNPILVDPVKQEFTYAQLREMAYPPIADQLDALWKGGEAAAAMLVTIQAVKAKFPKPTQE